MQDKTEPITQQITRQTILELQRKNKLLNEHYIKW